MVGVLFTQPRPDAMCRVPLLPRRLPVLFQHPVDSLFHRIQFGLFPLVLLSLGRDRTGHCLAHHSPVHSMLLRQSFDRLSGRIPPPDLFE
jgi:hypothetical protein